MPRKEQEVVVKGTRENIALKEGRKMGFPRLDQKKIQRCVCVCELLLADTNVSLGTSGRCPLCCFIYQFALFIWLKRIFSNVNATALLLFLQGSDHQKDIKQGDLLDFSAFGIPEGFLSPPLRSDPFGPIRIVSGSVCSKPSLLKLKPPHSLLLLPFLEAATLQLS